MNAEGIYKLYACRCMHQCDVRVKVVYTYISNRGIVETHRIYRTDVRLCIGFSSPLFKQITMKD